MKKNEKLKQITDLSNSAPPRKLQTLFSEDISTLFTTPTWQGHVTSTYHPDTMKPSDTRDSATKDSKFAGQLCDLYSLSNPPKLLNPV